MSDKYIAIGSIGTFLPNEEVTGLDEERLIELALLGKVRVVQLADDEPKAVSKMKVDELQTYITANGGEYLEDDNKPDLLVIAQAIEDELNNQE